MKNIDQNTPFLAFYDLLRIRGVYSEPEKREKLRRGFRRAMALAATVLAFALPQGARADKAADFLPIPSGSTEPMAPTSGNTLSLDAAAYRWNDFSIGSDMTVEFTAGTAVNKVSGGVKSEIWGTLAGKNVWILNPNGILFGSGSSVNVDGLVAAAVGSASGDFDATGIKFGKLGSGSVVNNGTIKASNYAVLVGKSVQGGDIASDNIALVSFGSENSGVVVSKAENGATITFESVAAEDDPDGELTDSGDSGDYDGATDKLTYGTLTGSTETSKANVSARATDAITTTALTANNVSIASSDKVTVGAAVAADGKVEISAGNAGANALTVNGTVSGKTGVSLSSPGNIKIAKDVTSEAGDVEMTIQEVLVAEGAEKPAMMSVKIQGGNVKGQNVTLGGKDAMSVQILAGSVEATRESVAATDDVPAVEAGKVSISADEYVVVNGNVTAKGDVEIETLDKAVLTHDLPGGNFPAGTAAGVNVLGGKVSGANVTIDSKGSIQTAAETEIGAAAGNVTLTAAGEKTEQVEQGINLAGKVSAVAAGGDETGETGNVTIEAAKGAVSVDTVTADNAVAVTAGDKLAAATGISGASVELTGKSVEGAAEVKATAGNLDVTATDGNVDLTGALSAAAAEGDETGETGNVTIKAEKGAVSVDTVTADNAVAVTAGDELAAATEITGATIELTGKSVTGEAAVTVNAGEGSTLSVTATDGDIELTGAVKATVGEEGNPIATTLTAEKGDVKLENVANDFDTVTAKAKNVALKDTNAVTLTEVGASAGAVDVTAGGKITATDVKSSGTTTLTGVGVDAATVDADGALKIDAGTGDLTVGTAVSGSSVELTGKSVTGAGTVTADSSTLKATASDGNVALTGVVKATGGAATLMAEKGDVSLKNAGNDFKSVTAKAKNVALKDTNAVTLTEVGASAGAVDVTAGGKITATDVKSSGTTTLTGAGVDAATVDADGALKIDAGTGDLTVGTAVSGSSVELTGKSVTGAAAVTVNAGEGAKLSATATDGDIELTGVVKATSDGEGNPIATTLSATGGSVKLDNAGNDLDSVTAEAKKDILVKDQNALELKEAKSSSGDVRAIAGKTLQVNGAVTASSGNVLLEGGGVTVDAAVSGKNVTVSDTGSSGATIHAKVTAGEDLYVKSEGGNVTATAEVKGGDVLALVAKNGSIDASKTSADTVFLEDKTGVQVGDLGAGGVIVKSGDEVTLTLSEDSTLALSAKGDVTVTSTAKVTIGSSTASSGGKVAITEVVEKGTKETELAGGSSGGSASGITAGQNATIEATEIEKGSVKAGGKATVTATSGNITGTSVSGKTTKVESKTGSVNAGSISGSSSATVTAKKDVTASSISGGKVDVTAEDGKIDVSGNVKGGPIDLKAENGAISAGSVSGGDVTMTSKDDVTVKESLDGKNVVIKAGGNLTVEGTTKVDTLDAGLKDGSVGGDATFAGDVDAKTVGIVAKGAIKTDGATIKTTDSISLEAGREVDVSLDSQKIEKVSGSSVKIDEKASGRNVVLGSVSSSSGDVEITARNIGGPNGTGGGFVEGNGDSLNFDAHGNLVLDVGGKVGTSDDPLEAKVGGTLVIKGGAMDAESADDAFLHVVLRNSVVPKVSYPSVFGLVIVNNQIMGGSKRLIRRMNRALAFTVNTPELKSTQGVFGESAFIHTGLDVSEARSIGSVAALSLDAPDYHGIFNELLDDPDTFAKMSPAINLGADPLKTKIEAVENPSAQPDVKSFQY